LTIASDAGTQYCPNNAALGVFSVFPASQAGITSGCIAARDLEADGSLAAYNPGWPQFTGAHWIGFTAASGPSSDYRPTPGEYLFQQAFVLPAGTNPTLDINVRADNVVAVYLNGTKLGQQVMHDCNDNQFGPCNWTSGGQLHVTATTGFVASPGTNYLSFIVSDVPTGYPNLTAPYGGASPQFGCITRAPQATGSHLFTNDQAVVTTAGHVGPHPTGPGNPMTPNPTVDTPNPGQDGCENPAGLAFLGTVTVTPPATTTWCSPGYWKNHLDAWSVANQNKLYSSLIPAGAPLSKKAPTSGAGSNPTLLEVISDPSTYGGPATNSVADYLSFVAFGTPIGTGIESCPLN